MQNYIFGPSASQVPSYLGTKCRDHSYLGDVVFCIRLTKGGPLQISISIGKLTLSYENANLTAVFRRASTLKGFSAVGKDSY